MLTFKAAGIPAFLLTIGLTTALSAAPQPPFGGLDSRYGYAELATIATAAPLAIRARIVAATRLDATNAPGLAPDRARYLVEAHVTALVAGRADLPQVIRYLVDLPLDPAHPKAKLKLKGVDVLLLAAPGGKPGEIRLIGPRAQVPATAENEARLRGILSAAVAPDAPPAIVGIGHAFHVAGSLPGEGETQIFVKTADNRPISLSILRRPGEEPRWAVALSEMVDASAAPPKPDTFLWYRLACGLPRTLPASAIDGLAPEDAQIAGDDYALVIKGLGPCDKGR